MIYGLIAGLLAGWLVAKSDKPKVVKYRRVTRRTPNKGRYKPSILMRRYNKILDRFDLVIERMEAEQPTAVPLPPKEPITADVKLTLTEETNKETFYLEMGTYPYAERSKSYWCFDSVVDEDTLPEYLQELCAEKFDAVEHILGRYDGLASTDQKIVTIALKTIRKKVFAVKFTKTQPEEHIGHIKSLYGPDWKANHE